MFLNKLVTEPYLKASDWPFKLCIFLFPTTHIILLKDVPWSVTKQQGFQTVVIVCQNFDTVKKKNKLWQVMWPYFWDNDKFHTLCMHTFCLTLARNRCIKYFTIIFSVACYEIMQRKNNALYWIKPDEFQNLTKISMDKTRGV